MKLPTESLAEPAESQKKALISLLADEDPAVYQVVREKLISYGPIAADWVRSSTLSNDPILRRRARGIIDYFGRASADREFLAFCLNNGEQLDLEKGSFLLGKTQYPGINIEGYTALLDSIVSELRVRLDLNGPPEDILNIINFHLYQELKFSGNEQGFFDPQNSYLNRVLDRRTGNPISLCIIYLLIARRLRLPMVGVALPGHFLCRYQTLRDEIYIDAFNGGKLLRKPECVRYVLQIRHRLDEGYLSPVPPRRMLLRCCANLFQIYTQLRQNTEVDRFQHYMVALADNQG